MVDMVMDVTGSEFNWDMKDDPKADSDDFYRMPRDADESLWSGYKIHIIL